MTARLKTRGDAERVMRANGHTPGEWRLGGGGRYPILVCTSCDRAAVLGDTHVYGTAIHKPCQTVSPYDEAIIESVIEAVLASPVHEFCRACGERNPYCACV